MIVTHILKPTDCFNITLLKNEYPFNIQFSNKRGKGQKECFYGPGIYSIFDKINNQVVYIGLWRPNDKNVISERFRKHIQTLTLRGNSVKFNKKSNVLLEDFCKKNNANNLIDLLSKCSSINKRLHSGGIVASSPKIRYASQNWKAFSNWSTTEETIQSLDDRFVLQFTKINNYFDKDLEAKILRSQIRKRFELPLINHCNPIANAEYNGDKETLQYRDKNGLIGCEIINQLIKKIINEK